MQSAPNRDPDARAAAASSGLDAELSNVPVSLGAMRGEADADISRSETSTLAKARRRPSRRRMPIEPVERRFFLDAPVFDPGRSLLDWPTAAEWVDATFRKPPRWENCDIAEFPAVATDPPLGNLTIADERGAQGILICDTITVRCGALELTSGGDSSAGAPGVLELWDEPRNSIGFDPFAEASAGVPASAGNAGMNAGVPALAGNTGVKKAA